MKGTVVLVWINSLKELYGEDGVEQVLEELKWKGESMITPTMDVDDEDAMKLVERIASMEGEEVGEVFRKMGRNNVWSFYEFFPSYFDQNSAKEFLSMMDDVHKQLTKMIAGANPPGLESREISPNTIKINYVSSRGLFDYFLGLLKGVGDFFNEDIEVEELSRGEVEGDNKYLEVKVITEKSTAETRNFGLSRLFSLGLIRDIPLKISFLSSVIITGITALVTWYFNPGLLLIFIVSFGTIYLASKAVLAPLSTLKEEIYKLKNLDYSQTRRVKTNDQLENIFQELFEGKQNIKKDLLFLKGGTDDMYKFVERFSQVSQNMKDLSEEISKMVEEVSQGAMQQAEETEGSADKLNTNVENIKEISTEELRDKESLEEAVENIKSSYEHINGVAEGLEDVKQRFGAVDSKGKELAKNVEDMLDIVTTVEEIAEQTNLLALNASIEAARAGEHGQGFGVVANEVRNLAENSGNAVATISDNLKSFVSEVEKLVGDITDQFSRLEESTQTLQSTAEETGRATNQINEVADKITTMAEKLSEETQNINRVFESINSLAAIAEENSAASQEMSSNVSEYSDRIKEMSAYTEQLKTLAGEFRSELQKHKV